MKTTFLSFLLLLTAIPSMRGQAGVTTFSYRIGEFELVLLSEGQQKGNVSILIGATPDILNRYVPRGTFPNAVNAFLLKKPGQNILIDTGFGNELFRNLEKAGVSPADIHIILITHMHGDHIEGLLREGEKKFPNAEVYIPKPEYDYWTSTEERGKAPEGKRGGFENARQIVKIYGDRIRLFEPGRLDSEGEELVSGISAIAAYGHTPGHTMYLLQSKGEKLLVWGDLTHAMAVQMPHPEIAVTYDVDPSQAAQSRKKVLHYVSTKQIPIAGMHISFPAIGSISKNEENGYIFTPVPHPK